MTNPTEVYLRLAALGARVTFGQIEDDASRVACIILMSYRETPAGEEKERYVRWELGPGEGLSVEEHLLPTVYAFEHFLGEISKKDEEAEQPSK